MRQFIFSLLSLCRQDLFEVFFPGTVSNTLYPFQELVCFMIVYSCQNLFLFGNYILFRNCFCQTNPFQELFLSNKSFSGMVFSKIVLWRAFWTEKLHDPDKIRSFTAFLKAYPIPSSFRNCHFWRCLFQDGSISNPLHFFCLNLLEKTSLYLKITVCNCW